MGIKYLLCIAAILALAAGAAIELKHKLDIPRLTDTRIVGGTETNIKKYPYQISLRYRAISYPNNTFSHRCGGAIYADDVIITAAHCVIGTVPSQFKIVAGTDFRTGSDGAVALVKKIVRHDDYDPDTYTHDIAIMFLSTPLHLNYYTTRTIELATSEPKNNEMSVITGWGTTTEGGTAPSVLQEVRVPIVGNDVCNEDYQGLIDETMLCAGTRGIGGKDACQGDSGGPLVVNNKLAGVVSWGFGCARAEYPGVYASVPYFYSWILETIDAYRKELQN